MSPWWALTLHKNHAFTRRHAKNLSHLPLLFQSARERIDVVSCGKMGGIPQMTLKEWLKNT